MNNKTSLSDDLSSDLISVIVPVYNAENFLCKALDCLINQSLPNLEIILVNDASTDKSYDICSEYAQKDPRIVLVDNPDHKGVSTARNTGLSLAKGNYISFLDADDWIEYDMMEYLLYSIKQANADIATCEIIWEYSDGQHIKKHNCTNYRTTGLFVINEINFSGDFDTFLVTKLFKKSAVKGIRFSEDVSIGEDYRFMMDVLIRNPVVYKGNSYKYHYRQHMESVCHKGFSDVEKVYRNRINFRSTFHMLKNHQSDLEEGALSYYILQEMAVISSMAKAQHYDKLTAKSVRYEIRRHIKQYLPVKKVPLHLKLCALLLSVHEILLLIPASFLYKKIIHGEINEHKIHFCNPALWFGKYRSQHSRNNPEEYIVSGI